MAKTAILAIRIISDAKNAIAGVDATNASVSKFEVGARKANAAAAVVTAGLLAMAKQAGDAASALEQSTGGVETVFGDQAQAVKDLAAGAADAVGLSRNSYQELATSLGGQLKGLGVAGDQVVGTTEGLIKTAADLAATYGGTTKEAVEALGSLFRGEADPIERYNVFVKQSDVNARLAAQGLDKLEGSALKQAETQARLAMVTEQTSLVNGKFASEANTAAGSSERFKAQLENAQAALGTALLPALTLGAQLLGGLAAWVEKNSSTAQFLAVVLGTVAVSMMAVNLAMSLNPIGLVIVAVAGLVAGIIWLIDQLGGIENVLAQMGNWWRDFTGWINDAANAIGNFLGLNNQAQSSGGAGFGGFGLMASPSPDMTTSGFSPSPGAGQPLSKSAPNPTFGLMSTSATPMALTAPSLPVNAAGRTAGTNAAPTVQNFYDIKVEGAVDRRGVAEEIRSLLDELARSRGEKVGAGGIRI
jgi:hypothetical protein